MPDPIRLAIDATTRCCAVYGHPVRHSASPAMHNAGIAALGLNWRYLAFDVEPSQLGSSLAGAKAMGFVGLNLTVPHKLLAYEMVDALDESGRTWGAVNTIRFEGRSPGGTWEPLHTFTDTVPEQVRSHGFNTDADAIIRSLREDLGFDPGGKSVLLLGAGGAGRTAALRVAAECPERLYLVNRTASKAEAVAREIVDRYPKSKVSVGYPPGEVDLLLNATSLGLKAGDPLPLEQKIFSIRRAGAVYDMVYRPAATELLKLAVEHGCRAANGLGMLLYQGAKALEIWTGAPAPVAVMRRALEENIYGRG